MRSTFTYAVTAAEIKLIGENDSTNGQFSVEMTKSKHEKMSHKNCTILDKNK